MDSTSKPYLIFCSTPADGHIKPMLDIALQLAKRQYRFSFLCVPSCQKDVEDAGGIFVPIAGLDDLVTSQERNLTEPGLPRVVWDMEHLFIRRMSERWEVLKEELQRVEAKNHVDEILVFADWSFTGADPLRFGAPLPAGLKSRPKVIIIGVSVYLGASIDTAPFGTALPPDSTPSGRLRNGLLERLMNEGPYAGPRALLQHEMRKLGATSFTVEGSPFSLWYSSNCLTLQLCPEGLEYVRSDQPSNVKFVGALPPRPLPQGFILPPFWKECTSGDKLVVTVSQGTLALDYSCLLLPTLAALEHRTDMIVVATLGKKDARLPAGVHIPSNARIIDYLPYDTILPHTSVFITNAGFGGILHGIANGVPFVLSGGTEDKPEVAMRAENAGIAVNLKTDRPTIEQIRCGVEQVLEVTSYKERVMEMRRDNERTHTIDLIEKYVLELV